MGEKIVAARSRGPAPGMVARKEQGRARCHQKGAIPEEGEVPLSQEAFIDIRALGLGLQGGTVPLECGFSSEFGLPRMQLLNR